MTLIQIYSILIFLLKLYRIRGECVWWPRVPLNVCEPCINCFRYSPIWSANRQNTNVHMCSGKWLISRLFNNSMIFFVGSIGIYWWFFYCCLTMGLWLWMEFVMCLQCLPVCLLLRSFNWIVAVCCGIISATHPPWTHIFIRVTLFRMGEWICLALN